MKRGSDSDQSSTDDHNKKLKIENSCDDVGEEARSSEVGFNSLDENLMYEVLKHVDAKTLATASCVNKTWSRTAADERLWELICTRHWNNVGCSNQQLRLRSVVLALGGFRRLHSLYIWPLPKPSTSSSSSASVSSSTSATAAAASPAWKVKPRVAAKWGKDEVHLSLSLLSIRYYEKMNFGKR